MWDLVNTYSSIGFRVHCMPIRVHETQFVLRPTSRTEHIVASTPRCCQGGDRGRRDSDCALMAFVDSNILQIMPMDYSWRIRSTIYSVAREDCSR
jgi:hypothetical protein